MLKKLKSDSGATILIALIFFLLCAVTGSVILASATSSSGRIAGLVKQEQAYYSVSSAAKLIRNLIENETFGYYILEGDYPESQSKEGSINEPMGDLKEMLEDGGKYIFDLSIKKRNGDTTEASAADYRKNLTISTADGLFPVNCSFTMKKDTYNITAEFSTTQDGKELYKMKLRIPAAKSCNLSEEFFTYNTVHGTEPDLITITHQYTRVSTVLSWGRGTIKKSGQDRMENNK